MLGSDEGLYVGLELGDFEVAGVCSLEGFMLGVSVGLLVGSEVGELIGELDGNGVGDADGFCVGFGVDCELAKRNNIKLAEW